MESRCLSTRRKKWERSNKSSKKRWCVRARRRSELHQSRVSDSPYYGVLAPAAKWRHEIVPDPPPDECPDGPDAEPKPREKNYTWAQLMARTFEFDVLQC